MTDRSLSEKVAIGSRAAHAGRFHSQAQQAISELIKSIPRGTHLSAPEVYERAKEAGLDISLSTVYRTLHSLQAHGNVTAVGGDRGRRYESAEGGDEHDHLICLKCGLTVEFADDLIKEFGRGMAARKGFDHQSSRFDVFGLCKECRLEGDHENSRLIDQLVDAATLAEQTVSSLRRLVEQLQSDAGTKSGQQVRHRIEHLQKTIDACRKALDDVVVE